MTIRLESRYRERLESRYRERLESRYRERLESRYRERLESRYRERLESGYQDPGPIKKYVRTPARVHPMGGVYIYGDGFMLTYLTEKNSVAIMKWTGGNTYPQTIAEKKLGPGIIYDQIKDFIEEVQDQIGPRNKDHYLTSLATGVWETRRWEDIRCE